jgi:DNA-directed RNA polymerase specialized sigma subunit
MTKEYRAVPSDEVFAKLPAARRAKIKERAAELIAEELGLQELRKSKQITQEEIAARLGGRQVYISRLEKRARPASKPKALRRSKRAEPTVK